MSVIMMQLGSYQFGLSTAAYQEFQRSTAYTWAAQSRFGKDDALQSTGPGADTITLTGVVFPEHFGGIGQLDEMRLLGGQGDLQTLIDGRGRMLGDWAIEGVEELGSIFAQAGVARRQQFTIKLRRGPDDDGTLGGLIESVAGAAALPGASSLIVSAKTLASTANNAAGGMLAGLNGSLASVTGFASQLGAQASGVISAVRGGINAARTLQNAGSDVGRLLASVKNLSNLPSAMNGLVNIGGNVSRAAGTASSILKLAGVDLTASGVNPAAISAVRDGMVGINQLNVLAVSVRTTAQSIIGKV